jgi:hypothetical protein
MKRHRFDPFSFLFGALFLVVGGTFLFGGSGLDVARPARMWAAAAVVVGVSLAAWAVMRVVRKEPPAPIPAVVDAEGIDTSPDLFEDDPDPEAATPAGEDGPV